MNNALVVSSVAIYEEVLDSARIVLLGVASPTNTNNNQRLTEPVRCMDETDRATRVLGLIAAPAPIISTDSTQFPRLVTSTTPKWTHLLSLV
jgi:hypothetical protein